jgi:hypothetical protein
VRSARSKPIALAAAATAIIAVIALNAGAKGGARPSGGRAVLHQNGRALAAESSAVAKTYSIGGHALEPTLGFDPSGNIYYAAAGFDSVANLPGTQILRSGDGGRTWKNTSPRVLGQNSMPITLDPYVWVDDIDGDNARIFTIDLTVACSYMSFSDDKGKTWTTNPLSCGRPVNDHQTLFSGPPAESSTVGYPNIVYYCWNDVGSSSCSKSIDGGITFHPTGTPAFSGVDPSGDSETGFFGQNGFCGGLHGHGTVGPDGTVFLPREYCGKPMLAISRDEGQTWTNVQISKIESISQPREGAGHPSVAVDEKGNVYYMWIAAKDRLPYFSVSTNGGKKWSDPVLAGPPGLKETNLPQLDARGKGKVALVYYGSTNSPFPRCGRDCEEKDYQPTTWNAYLTVSANALDRNPTFITGTVNDPKDPLIRARCGPGRCHWAYDFIDVEISNEGMAYGAFVDGCMKSCTKIAPRAGEYEGLITTLTGAPRLH